MRPIVGFALLASVTFASVQQPFSTPLSPDKETDGYQFKWPIQRVAVIGAGPSGLFAYRELTEAGLEVRVFERDSVPGGNWHYTEQVPLDAPVPNAPCAVGDFVPSLPPANVDLPYSEEFEDDGEVRRDHNGPKPIWESLASNAPSLVQQFPQWPWPVGTEWELSHYQLRNYVRSYASYLNINSNDGNPATSYDTRVELVEKRINEAGEEQGWRLWLKSLQLSGHNTYRATWWTEDFDAVVVASGRYNAPLMPNIPGLQQWVERFPYLVRHSRQYRRPEVYANQTVLIVGASVSGAEISRDLNPHARKIYQSVRPANDTNTRSRLQQFRSRIPSNTTFVGEIKQFLPIAEGSPIYSGRVELKNGTILTGIDSVILATGFRYSYPFLPQYYDGTTHEPRLGSSRTASTFLPLTGLYIRDLYLDVFYIEDPTLAFLSVPTGTQTFLLIDYTALALAKVWTNKAKLPNTQTMRTLYENAVEGRGGYGKNTLFLGSELFEASIKYLNGWLNEAATKYGGKQVDGFPKHFAEVSRYWRLAHYGGSLAESTSEEDGVLPSLGLDLGNDVDKGSNDDIWFYDGDW